MTDHPFTRRGFAATGIAALLATRAGIAQAQTVQLPSAWAFNIRTALTPARIAAIRSEADAQSALAAARAAGQGFSLRSGGHCFEGLSQHRQTVLNLGPLNHVEMLGSDRLRVGPGARIGDLNAVTGPLGRVLPAGFCQGVGIGGHIGGGGLGLYARPFGTASDHLEAARVILADGRAVTASADNHPDLFWALRGGGSGSFGIVTDFTFRLRPVSRVIYIQIFWEGRPKDVAPVVAEWQRRAATLPNGIGAAMFLRAQGGGLVQAHLILHSVVAEDQAIPAARMMHAIAPPRIDPIVTILPPHEVAEAIWPRDYNPSFATKLVANLQTRPTSSGRWLQVLQAMAAREDQALSINLDLLGGAVDDPAIADTAFPHRGTTLMTAQYELRLNDRTPKAEQVRWMRALQAITAADASKAAYINYPDRDLDDFANRYWGPNLPRLQAIKARYDPGNVFRHDQSVPLP